LRSGPSMTPAARIASAIELVEAVLEPSGEGADADGSLPPDPSRKGRGRIGARPADAVAHDFFRARRFIGSGDRRDISERVWRVLRSRRRLDWWLGGHATPRLLVAASLLLEGARYAQLAEAFSGGRFAPTPLSRSEQAMLRRLEGHALEHPSMPEPVRLEVPDWLFPRIELAELRALLEPAPLDLRVNLLKATREDASAALAAEGIEAAPTPLSPWGLRIEGRRQVTTGSAFRAGLVEIQDEGSQLVAALVDARPGMRVADLCAGAGGKTLALAMTMQNRGQLVACDISAARLDGAVRRLRRAGVHNVERHLLEPGDKWIKRRARSFDRVLVDAPCTGTGTWRRNPDARLRLAEADLAELLPKQAVLLDQAASMVRTGGRLVYATCSLLAEENEDQVTAFLSRHSGFAQGDVLVLTPARNGTDGFFAAVLERRQ
jgi:16S rRNA (cytosine967-C5)-methyltransferase